LVKNKVPLLQREIKLPDRGPKRVIAVVVLFALLIAFLFGYVLIMANMKKEKLLRQMQSYTSYIERVTALLDGEKLPGRMDKDPFLLYKIVEASSSFSGVIRFYDDNKQPLATQIIGKPANIASMEALADESLHADVVLSKTVNPFRIDLRGTRRIETYAPYYYSYILQASPMYTARWETILYFSVILISNAVITPRITKWYYKRKEDRFLLENKIKP